MQGSSVRLPRGALSSHVSDIRGNRIGISHHHTTRASPVDDIHAEGSQYPFLHGSEWGTGPPTLSTRYLLGAGLQRNVPARPRTASPRITQGSNISPMALMHAHSTAHTPTILTNANDSGELAPRAPATPTREATSESVDDGVSASEVLSTITRGASTAEIPTVIASTFEEGHLVTFPTRQIPRVGNAHFAHAVHASVFNALV